MRQRLLIATACTLLVLLVFREDILEWLAGRTSDAVSAPVIDPNVQLRQWAHSFAFAEIPQFSPAERQMAALGRKMFFDTRFSKNQKHSCGTCHVPSFGFTDGKRVAEGIEVQTKNTPTLINAFAGSWFFWDGRADSLAAQALGPLENPGEQGISRARLVQIIYQHYLKEYEDIFGEFPDALRRLLEQWRGREFHAYPKPPELNMPIELAAYAVATINSFSIQQRYITQAAARSETPQRTLAKLAMTPGPTNPEWVARWHSLSPEEQAGINKVTAHVGQAFATFERGIAAVQSPFDAFISRLGPHDKPEAALGEGFGEEELKGLRVFITKGCPTCHNGPNLTDQQFHNIGLPQKGEELEVGRARGVFMALNDPFNCRGGLLPGNPQSESCLELPFLDTLNLEMVGAWKTPTLRNVAQTAPYMHDGRFKTLREVLEHYNRLEGEPALGHTEESLKPLRLSNTDMQALEAFLNALTSPVRDLSAEEPPATVAP